ncbi:2-oxoglutarate carboxylase large subunit [mine drainage metagenome]|uniref:2-oxoglutarate carboxylase large subunit n=1 Tax=mine drainage metagenome TaxID=410659 RepID=A0A1J5S9C4_9ZZZZ
MHKKFRISVDGRSYDVVVEEIPDFPHADSPAALPGTPAPALNAPPLAVPPPAAAPAPAAAAASGDEVAPLAGMVEAITVKVGQVVAAGDKIATIEAMKMKTDVFAKGSGTVSAIAVQPQQSVDSGQVLLTLA